jgi:tetratricopeptide (TPR) repeat protein
MNPIDISPTHIQEIGKEIDAQGIITGEIYRIALEDEEFIKTEETRDPETDTVIKSEIPWIRRHTTLGLTYHVYKTENGALYAFRSFEASLQDEAQEDYYLRESEDMYKEIIDSFIPLISRQLAPYTVREKRKLMKDKSQDPVMENATQYARNGMYDHALELYLEVWNANRNPAAGYNGAIMNEVRGDMDAAVSLMEEVIDLYPDKKIMNEYHRLLEVREEQKRVAEQFAQSA